jgi:predicted nucleotidyltransferase
MEDKSNRHIDKLTPYKDVNEILQFFTSSVTVIFKKNLTGIYLTGSLSYGAFHCDRSDIDITVILINPISRVELEAIKIFHKQIEAKFNKWAKRLECTYTPVEMLPSILPPEKPRPWYWGGEGILYEEAPYGNEWIINNYLLYNYAIPLFGPDFKELTGPIDIEEVQKACIRDLFTEWEPKIANKDWLNDSHYESYFILNLCRILYTVMCKSAGTKDTATAWAKNKYGAWADLINSADQWQDGIELNIREKTIEFTSFVIDQVSKTEIYYQLVDEINNIRAQRA